jgi:hypothetical protein
MPNIRLKRYTGAAWENVDVQTEWAQILNKPTTFTPTSHTHGNISNAGVVNTNTAAASGQHLLITSTADLIQQSSITLGTSTTTFLRNDGQWASAAAAANDITQILTSDQDSDNDVLTWKTAFTFPTLDINSYYEIQIVGIHDKTTSNTSNRMEVGFLQSSYDTSTSLGTIGTSYANTAFTNIGTWGIDTQASTSTRTPLYTATTGSFFDRPFTLIGILFTGSIQNQVFSFRHKNTAQTTSGLTRLVKGTYIKYRKIA